MPLPPFRALIIPVALCAWTGAMIATGELTRAAESKAPAVEYDAGALPERVRQMRSAILEAARTGDIETMRPVLESNELMPLVADGPVDDPIAYWKKVSADGTGREILAILGEILDAGFVRLRAGKPDEIFVWPYFAETSLATLTPAQQVEFHRLVPAAKVEAMTASGRYDHYRLGIGRDGTWHYFIAGK